MTDIWDEKPDAELIDIVQNVQGYEATEMDAWLEKLKEHYEGLETGYKHCFEAFNKLVSENSELKEKAEKFDRYCALSWFDPDTKLPKPMGEPIIKSLLESSPFKEISELASDTED